MEVCDPGFFHNCCFPDLRGARALSEGLFFRWTLSPTPLAGRHFPNCSSLCVFVGVSIARVMLYFDTLVTFFVTPSSCQKSLSMEHEKRRSDAMGLGLMLLFRCCPFDQAFLSPYTKHPQCHCVALARFARGPAPARLPLILEMVCSTGLLRTRPPSIPSSPAFSLCARVRSISTALEMTPFGTTIGY